MLSIILMFNIIDMFQIICFHLKSSFFCSLWLFCSRRNRAIKSGESPYTVLKESVVFADNTIEANILNTRNNITLQLQLFTLEKNTARFKISEINPIRPRYEVKDSLVTEPKSVRYNENYKEQYHSCHLLICLPILVHIYSIICSYFFIHCLYSCLSPFN